MLRIAIVATALASLASGQPSGDPWARVEALYRQRVQDTGIVGSSLLFLSGGEVAHRATAGYQDVATKRPVDRETIFHWASITKMFTGVAIMQLRDRGLLSLDDPADQVRARTS